MRLPVARISHFKKNDFIFKAGQPSEYIGIILDGFIEIQNNLKSGKLIITLYKKKGEVFGEESVFSSNTTYQFDIVAKTQCDILLINKQSILKMLFKDSIISFNILSMLANNALTLNKVVELFSYSSIQKKTAYCLLYNINLCDNQIIQLPFSKTTWAEHLNVSRSSLCRELKKFSNDGIITVNNKVITILKRKKLESLLDN